MRRNLSPQGVESLTSHNSSDVWLLLLTIETDAFGTVRFVNNSEDIESRGHPFTAYPFQITLPESSLYRDSKATLEIDNVDRRLVTMVRTMTKPARVTIEVIRASDPDDVEIEVKHLFIFNSSWTAQAIVFELGFDDIWNSPFPSGTGTYSPRQFPTLF